MLKFPRRLGIIEGRGVPCKLKLLHHRVRPTFFSLEQKRHVNFEFDKLCCLIFVAARGSLIQRLETLPRLRIVLFLKGNLREVVLCFPKFRIQLGCFFKCSFGLVKLLLLHQNLATQIEGRRLIRIRLIRFID